MKSGNKKANPAGGADQCNFVIVPKKEKDKDKDMNDASGRSSAEESSRSAEAS